MTYEVKKLVGAATLSGVLMFGCGLDNAIDRQYDRADAGYNADATIIEQTYMDVEQPAGLSVDLEQVLDLSTQLNLSDLDAGVLKTDLDADVLETGANDTGIASSVLETNETPLAQKAYVPVTIKLATKTNMFYLGHMNKAGEFEQVYESKIITGRKRTPTRPGRYSLTRLTINPAWHVPRKIWASLMRTEGREMRRLLREGLYKRNRHGHYRIPGPDNPIGQFAFRLARGKGAHVMHGTRHQHLFKKSDRNLSHGCIRLDKKQLRATAEYLMKNEPHNSDVKVENITDLLKSKETKVIRFKNPIKVKISYY